MSEISAFIAILIATVVIPVIEWAVRRFVAYTGMTAGNVAKTLSLVAGWEIVVAIAYAFPFPAPPKPGVWIFPLAALITFWFAAGVWTMDSRKPTPAVQRSRARRQSR